MRTASANEKRPELALTACFRSCKNCFDYEGASGFRRHLPRGEQWHAAERLRTEPEARWPALFRQWTRGRKAERQRRQPISLPFADWIGNSLSWLGSTIGEPTGTIASANGGGSDFAIHGVPPFVSVMFSFPASRWEPSGCQWRQRCGCRRRLVPRRARHGPWQSNYDGLS